MSGNVVDISSVPTDPTVYSFHGGVGHPLNPVRKDVAEAHLQHPLRVVVPLPLGTDPKPLAATMLAHLPESKSQAAAAAKPAKADDKKDHTLAILKSLGIAAAAIIDPVVWLDRVPEKLVPVCDAVASSCVEMVKSSTFVPSACALKKLPSSALDCPIR